MSKDKKDEEMICGLTMDEQDLLRRELRDLPETMPPRVVWDRIREQAEAEGLLRATSTGRPTWMALAPTRRPVLTRRTHFVIPVAVT